MNTLPAANIVVSFNRQAMDRLFSVGATSKNLIGALKNKKDHPKFGSFEEDVLLFNSESNPNFIAFEHKFGYGAGKTIMSLTFIDPKGEFEKRYLTTSLLTNIASYAHPTQDEERKSWGEGARDRQQREMQRLGKGDAYYAEFKDSYKKSYGGADIWIAYGIGDTLETWAGPYLMKVTGATITVKGPKKIKLDLTPTTKGLQKGSRRDAYNQEINLNLRGVRAECEGEAGPLNTKNYFGLEGAATLPSHRLRAGQLYPDNFYPGDSGYREAVNLRLNTSDVLNKLNLAQAPNSSFGDLGEYEGGKHAAEHSDDIHRLVVDTLRSYIQKATGNDNVIVLLPNLRLICREAFITIAKQQRTGLIESRKLHIFAEKLGTGSFAARVFNDLLEAASYTKLLKSGQVPAEGAGRGDQFGDRVWSSYEVQVMAAILAYLQTVLSDLGLRMTHDIKSQWNNNGIDGESHITRFGQKSWINSDWISYVFRGEAYQTPREAAASYVWTDYLVGRGNFMASLVNTSDEGVPNHQKAVDTVISKINNLAQGAYSIVPVTITETDTKILDIWSKSLGHLPIIGGEVPMDPTREVIVYGDRALIKDYLYGGADIPRILEDQDYLQGTADNYAEQQKKAIAEVNQAAARHKLAVDRKEANKYKIIYRIYRSDDPDPKQQAEAELERRFGRSIERATKAYEEARAALQILKLTEVQQLIKSEMQIPLHQNDRVSLLGAYRDEIKALLHPKRTKPLIGPFGDVSYQPDTFGHLDISFTKEEKEAILEDTVPIFRYNTENPNVVDMNFKFSKVYFGELDWGLTKEINRRASGVVEGVLDSRHGSFGIRSVGAAAAYLETLKFTSLNSVKQARALRLLVGKLDPGFVGDISLTINKSPEEFASMIGAILNKNLDKANKVNLKVTQDVFGSPEAVIADLAEQLYKKAMQLRIKTIPNFHISKNGSSTLGTPCILLAQDAPILQSSKSKRTGLNNFFSGGYSIMGFKHTINATGGAMSEFELVKIMPSPQKTKEEGEDD